MTNPSEPNTPAKPSGDLKLGPFLFQPGISGGNVAALIFATFATMATITYVNFVQPFLLTEMLQIPQDRQGALTGRLGALHEIAVIFTMGIAGALSDRTGRRIVFVIGFCVLALGYLVYPLATQEWQLLLFRLIVAVGCGLIAVMLSASIQDFPKERSRGRWVGFNAIFNGCGVLFMAIVFAKLPAWYQASGVSVIGSGRYAFWTVAAFSLLVAVIVAIGLPAKTHREARQQPSFKQRLRLGFSAAARNPRLGLAYGAAFIGRGDLVVVGTFFSLWIVQVGIDAGASTGSALGRAGMLFGLIQGAALLWAFGMGMLADRINRVVALIVALTIAGAGYVAMGTVSDPFSNQIIPICILLGMGETSVVVAGGALLGQEAPGSIRGSVVGVYGLAGGIGILVATLVGGMLFDDIGRTAPFTMMGLANILLAVIALAVVLARRHSPRVATPERL